MELWIQPYLHPPWSLLVTSRREPCNPTIPSPSRRLEGNPEPNHTFTLQKGTLDPTLPSPSRLLEGNLPNHTFTLQKGTLDPTLTSPSWREPCTQPSLYPILPSPSRRLEGNPAPNHTFTLQKGTLDPTLPLPSWMACTQPYLHPPEWNPVPNPTFTLQASRREPCNQSTRSPCPFSDSTPKINTIFLSYTWSLWSDENEPSPPSQFLVIKYP